MFRNGFKSLREIADFWEHLIVTGNSNSAEKSMRSLLQVWRERHIGFNYRVKPKAGDFYWIEYGNNLDPEMSYEHIGLIIKVKNNLLHTIPITTPKNTNKFHQNAFHSMDNPSGNTLFLKLNKVDFPFLKHDSVAKVSEIKSVSKKRLRQKLYHMDISNPLIKEIVDFAHKNLFDDHDYLMNALKRDNSLLKIKLELSNIPLQIEKDYKFNFSKDYIFEKSIDGQVITITLTDEYGQSVHKTVYLKSQG